MIRPSQLSPEFCTLDLENRSHVFSWKSNIITQYGFQLLIYSNADDTLVYDSELQVSTSTSFTLPANSVTNQQELKYIIRQYATSETYIDSEFILFKTALAPQVSINSVPTVTQEFEFIADVVLDESAVIQKFKYLLYDNFNTVIYDSGYIYDYVPKHKITGLLPSFPYRVKVEIIDSNGQSSISDSISFTIAASTSNLELFTVTPINDFATVQIDFTPLNQTFGTVNGACSYTTGKFGKGIKLESGSSLTFEKTIQNTYSISFYAKLPSGFTGGIVTLDDIYTIFYDGTAWGYQFGDFITIGKNRVLPSDSFIKIILFYGRVIVQTINYIEII